MDYENMYKQLQMIKKNPYHMSQKQRLIMLITTLGEHPEAIYMYKDLFISPSQLARLQAQGISGWSLTQHILSHCEIVTSNSTELTYKYYGYVRRITPALMDQLIDEVATRIQLEKEYAESLNKTRLKQEDELTLGELQQFC